MKKPRLLGIIIILVILAAGVGLAWPRAATAPEPSGSPSPTATATAQTYSGKVVCLPHKDTTGPQTMECALGLEASDGHRYGVKTTASGQFDVGNVITVKGTLTSPTADEKYDVAGTIDSSEITVEKQ